MKKRVHSSHALGGSSPAEIVEVRQHTFGRANATRHTAAAASARIGSGAAEETQMLEKQRVEHYRLAPKHPGSRGSQSTRLEAERQYCQLAT